MSISQKTDYTSEALSRLLSTLQGDDAIDGLIASFVDRCQELEDVGYEIIVQRDIDAATGARLDRIGAIVGVARGGREDAAYRLRIRAESAILNSDGLAEDLITILGLLLALEGPPFDVELSEAFPKAVILRPRNAAIAMTDTELDGVLNLLRRAVSGGTDIELVYSQSEASDANIFHLSPVTDTTQNSQTYGTENGSLCGAAL
jgi:hypothetical protein